MASPKQTEFGRYNASRLADSFSHTSSFSRGNRFYTSSFSRGNSFYTSSFSGGNSFYTSFFSRGDRFHASSFSGGDRFDEPWTDVPFFCQKEGQRLAAHASTSRTRTSHKDKVSLSDVTSSHCTNPREQSNDVPAPQQAAAKAIRGLRPPPNGTTATPQALCPGPPSYEASTRHLSTQADQVACFSENRQQEAPPGWRIYRHR